MKKFIVLTGAMALAANCLGQLVIKEVDEGIAVFFNGSAISPTITGPKDGWTIQLPAGFVLSPNLVGQFFDLGEPESLTEHNQVAITQPDTLTWDSDLQGAGTAVPFPATTFTIVGAGNFISAAGVTTPFDMRISDEVTGRLPDTASTAALLGLTAIGLLSGARRRARLCAADRDGC